MPVEERSLSGPSPLRRFVTVTRDYGLAVALRVAYSKVRGRLCPALALPGAPIYNTRRREVSVLLGTAGQGPATLDAVVEVLAGRGGSDWEVCICERSPVAPDTARTLARIRGTQPWIRIVTSDKSIDDVTAARWTVEQATGQFVALVAPGYLLDTGAITRLLAQLHNGTGVDAAVLIGTERAPSSPTQWAGCRLVLQRKSGYLAALPERWPLTAPALAKYLDEAGVPTVYIPERKSEAPD